MYYLDDKWDTVFDPEKNIKKGKKGKLKQTNLSTISIKTDPLLIGKCLID